MQLMKLRPCLALLRFSTLLAAALPVARAENAPVRSLHADSPSPEVAADGKVTFRLKAPNAKEVKVSGQFGPDAVLTKDDKGLWSATVGPVPAGVFEYHFNLDGMNALDPFNPWIKPQRQPGSSILHISANPPAPWDLQDVPHGTVHLHDYYSKTLFKWRHAVVYTPPGYEKGAEKLPVLYLSHGFSDNDQSWTVHGKAHWILDSLIASQKAAPMLIVMPDAHPLPPGPGWNDGYATKNSAAFATELVSDVLPLIESTYRVKAEPAARAFAGLSMGGRHALTIALNYSDTFSAIGAFSSAPPEPADVEKGFSDPAGLNSRLKLLWIACGKDDFLFKKNEDFTALLKSKDIHFEYSITEGSHSWPVWRNYLTTFAPRLFKP